MGTRAGRPSTGAARDSLPRMSRGFAAALALVLALLTPPRAFAQDPAPEAAGPPEGAWLRYGYDERLSEGTGEYDGYVESTTARARYEVVAVTPEQVTIRGQYTWRYHSPQRTESQTEDRTVAFSLANRRYVGRQTDSSDYDDREATTLATWIWIPPDVAVGDIVPILDHDFEVVSIDAPVVVAGATRTAIELFAERVGARDDDYGRFTTRTRDRYFFDRATGMFLREEVDEQDTGSLEGRPASFRMVTRIDVIDSSYAPSPVPVPDDPPPPQGRDAVPVYDGEAHEGTGDPFPCVFWGAVLGVIALALWWLLRQRKRPNVTPAMLDGSPFTVEQVTDPSTLAPPASLSPVYAPFLVHFATVAKRAGGPVAIARKRGAEVVGLAFGDRETEIGTIFADDPDVCEALRKAIGCSEFFSERRHGALATVTRAGLASPPSAYNVYETYEVLALTERPADLGYDRDAVTRMTPEDRAGVVTLLRTAYSVPCERWLDASLAEGDLAWVARSEGRIVGVAMASLCGTSAHLHALTVEDAARNRGLGTALMRARLRALFDLGATRIVSECATWNLGAREVASRHGLTKVGEMYVESSDAAREARKIVRR